MARIQRVDHVTYAVNKGMIEKWAWFHIEVEGARLIERIDDVDPSNPDSSMKIWCFDYGGFGIALVEGIDRAKKSHVTAFVERHGDHSVQHVAYDVGNLDEYISHLQANGVKLQGEPVVKRDAFGILKQVFCKGYAALDVADAVFPEYVERPRLGTERNEVQITFSQQAGNAFYRQIEKARAANDTTALADFSRMPSNWRCPEPHP
jgi:hypothetical protein